MIIHQAELCTPVLTRWDWVQSGIQSSANANPAVTVAAAAAAAAQPAQPKGYVPTARHNGCSALPVPTVAYTESERGLRVDRAGMVPPCDNRESLCCRFTRCSHIMQDCSSQPRNVLVLPVVGAAGQLYLELSTAPNSSGAECPTPGISVGCASLRAYSFTLAYSVL